MIGLLNPLSYKTYRIILSNNVIILIILERIVYSMTLTYLDLIIFAFKAKNITYMSDINRIKVALVESKKTSKWLAQQLGKNPATVSK